MVSNDMCATVPIDRQQDPDAAHKADERATTCTDEWQGESRRRDTSRHDSEVDRRLDSDQGGDPDGEKRFKSSFCLFRRGKTKSNQSKKQDHRDDRPDQPEFFPYDRKNEIRLSKWEKEIFLPTIKEPYPKDPATAQCIIGLN